jgi:flap endonuclease GEN
MIKEAKRLGMALGIPCLDGLEEAEAQCASLDLESLCDGCFTSDSDAFLFGARTVYRDVFIGEADCLLACITTHQQFCCCLLPCSIIN